MVGWMDGWMGWEGWRGSEGGDVVRRSTQRKTYPTFLHGNYWVNIYIYKCIQYNIGTLISWFMENYNRNINGKDSIPDIHLLNNQGPFFLHCSM